MNFQPNYEQFLSIFTDNPPDYVPFYEHYADLPIMESVLKRKCPQTNPSSFESKKDYMKFYVDFYRTLGYDVLPFEIGLKLFVLPNYHAASGRVWETSSDRSTIIL